MTVVIKAGSVDLSGVNILYENVLSLGTFTFSTQQDGFNAVNSNDDDTWNSWKPSAVPAWIASDMGSAVICDSVGVSAHTMATAGASFRVQYSSDGVSWTDAFASYTPTSNEDILVFFSAISARYWRFYTTGAIANYGVIRIGEKLAFPNAPISGHKPLHHARTFEMLSNESMGGNFIGTRVVRKGAETSVNIGQVDRDWAETYVVKFEEHFNTGKTFFYCGSPLDTPADMGYCKRPGGDKELSFTWVEGDVMADISFGLMAYVAT